MDPRVLESLDAELDFPTDNELQQQQNYHRYSNSSNESPSNRHYSYSSTSEQLSLNDANHSGHKWPGRSSIESLVTTSSTPSMPNTRQNRVVEGTPIFIIILPIVCYARKKRAIQNKQIT